MPIAVTGATGKLGRIVVAKLRNKIAPSEVVALARAPEKGRDLEVSMREADYTRPETLKSALQGIDTLLLISSSEIGQRAAQHHNVIMAAREARIKRLVYTSLLHADTSPLSLAEEHQMTEAAIRASGIPFTILRNGWYTENYTGSIAGALSGGAFLGSARDGKISLAPRVDYAEAASAVLTTSGHEGKVYELAGDIAYTLSDLAAEISRQTGKSIPYRDLPEVEYAATLRSFGLPDLFARSIASWDVGASEGALLDTKRELSKLIGRPTTPLSVTVGEALAALR